VSALPHDVELERAVLAELVDPLHPGLLRLDFDESAFYVYRHQRIGAALLDGYDLTPGDVDYLAEATSYAHPLVRGDLDRFLDLARRRARLAALDYERLALLGGSR
jgi:hypothetical protein